MGAWEIGEFLTDLAVRRKISPFAYNPGHLARFYSFSNRFWKLVLIREELMRFELKEDFEFQSC